MIYCNVSSYLITTTGSLGASYSGGTEVGIVVAVAEVHTGTVAMMIVHTAVVAMVGGMKIGIIMRAVGNTGA